MKTTLIAQINLKSIHPKNIVVNLLTIKRKGLEKVFSRPFRFINFILNSLSQKW
jgi:hypothetical protein